MSLRSNKPPGAVKLLKRDESQFVFLIGKRERQMMFNLIERYPVLSHAYHQTKAAGKQARETEKLLHEALADQQKENKRHVQEMLSEAGRFTEDPLGYQFALKPSEVEWLLQVFNDIRIGSWVKLGSPDLYKNLPAPLTEENVKLSWAMEIAGLFESELLQALDSSE